MGNVLIIGASGDIGAAIATRLAEEGHQLILHYNRGRERVEQLVSTLPEHCVLRIINADLQKGAGINNFLKEIQMSVHSIVFASGSSHFGMFQDTTEEEMDQMFTLHVKAPWQITKHFLPDMVKIKSGHIVMISSIWGEVGASFEVIYSTVKGAQNSFVKALAKEVAMSGVSVNGISPGFIDTKMNQHLSEEERQEIIQGIPINRPGKPDEVAHVTAFLLDGRSSYIQGEIIRVSGAW